MKKILKLYGLPRTGTNVLYWLLTLNFKHYVCDLSEFGVQYLGWKHGWPISQEVLNAIIEQTQEQPLFVFTKRNYDTWKEAILKRHQNTWEFPGRYKSDKVFFYNTPLGFETYKDILDFYEQRTKVYEKFCLDNPEITIEVSFEDLQDKQTEVITRIKEKFNLDSAYEKIIEIHKKINCSGYWENYYKNQE